MADTGTLVLRWGVDLSQLTSGMARANALVSKSTRQMERDFQTFARSAAAPIAVATAVGGALFLVSKRAIESGDALAKTADRLGIATEKLVGLRHAADLSGSSAEQLDKALAKQARNVIEAAKGYGDAARELKALGLDAQALARMPIDEQFVAIGTAINGVGSAAERVQIAEKIFGRGGAELLQTLDLGAEGIAAMQAEAEALGIALSRVDTAQLEAADDAMTRAGRAVDGLTNQIGLTLAPFIEEAANQFSNAAKEANGFANEVRLGLDLTIGLIGVYADAWRAVHIALKTVELGAFQAAAGVNLIFAPFLNQDLVDASVASVQRVREELETLWQADLPSEALKRQVEEIASKSRQAALDAIGQTPPAASLFSQPDDEDDVKKQLDAYAKVLEQKMVIEDDYAERHIEVLDRMAEYDLQNEQWLTEAKQAEHDARVAAGNKALGDLSILMASHSRKAFEVGKVAAMSETVISTISSAQKSYEALAGIPYIGPALGIAAAAAAVAAGVVRLQAIKSTSFGSRTVPGARGTIPTANVGSGDIGQGGRGAQTVTVRLSDDRSRYTRQEVAEIFDGLNEYAKDGGATFQLAGSN